MFRKLLLALAVAMVVTFSAAPAAKAIVLFPRLGVVRARGVIVAQPHFVQPAFVQPAFVARPAFVQRPFFVRPAFVQPAFVAPQGFVIQGGGHFNGGGFSAQSQFFGY